ncbi:hypothetical protein LWI28_004573 [Acer negundo]|uniref:Zinc knuckle CX2CX4HX4C domain-containing protein n=1 Tax=Acer negundo TaxID=4023 RepID=A0AAD5P5H5_ACENE|nr:hypothetical protein LWI28_004573 [Acer negundo]
MIGEVRGIDLEDAKMANSRFIRVRVCIAANEPFMRSVRVDLLGNGKITTMLLSYERLLDYCFKCRRLGHSLLPPTRFPFRNDRSVRQWGRTLDGGANNRRPGNWWKGKGPAEEEARAGERWMSNFPSD